MAEFTCDACGGTFTQAWDEAEAKAEFDAAFPDGPPDGEPPALVCEDCWLAMRERFPPLDERYR